MRSALRTPGAWPAGRAPAVHPVGRLEVAWAHVLRLRARGQACPHKHLLSRCGPPTTRVRDSPAVCRLASVEARSRRVPSYWVSVVSELGRQVAV